MSLTRVTITGADDRVDVADLAALTGRFPFVEWGILVSKKRAGEPRFPSYPWIDAFAEARLRSAMHVCGERSRELLLGDDFIVDKAAELGFSRIQVNGWEPSVSFVEMASGHDDVEFILQARDLPSFASAAVYALAVQRLGGKASVLVDPSGGTGRRIEGFPSTFEGVYVGYAGGIDPDNVAEVITEADETVDAPFWIDMESGARTDDVFDVAKVERVLEVAAPFVRGGR